MFPKHSSGDGMCFLCSLFSLQVQVHSKQKQKKKKQFKCLLSVNHIKPPTSYVRNWIHSILLANKIRVRKNVNEESEISFGHNSNNNNKNFVKNMCILENNAVWSTVLHDM